MGQAIWEFLPMAVALTIIPIPIVAVILMLFSERARQNGVASLTGWILGVAAAMSILLVVVSSQDPATDEGSSATLSWIKVILGAILVLLAVREWRKRPAAGVEVEMPRWMQRIDSMEPGGAFGLGILLAAANPKNPVAHRRRRGRDRAGGSPLERDRDRDRDFHPDRIVEHRDPGARLSVHRGADPAVARSSEDLAHCQQHDRDGRAPDRDRHRAPGQGPRRPDLIDTSSRQEWSGRSYVSRRRVSIPSMSFVSYAIEPHDVEKGAMRTCC